MVSFTSITQGVAVISILFLRLSDAAPAQDTPAPHVNGTTGFTFPPIIESRVQPVTNPTFEVNLDAETGIIETNMKWFAENGGDLKSITKRTIQTVDGMTMELPANAPPIPLATSDVIQATSAQLQTFELHAGLSASAYCRDVTPLGLWICKNCRKYAPDGKLIISFDSTIADTHGFVLRSDEQKTIHVVFRGTSSIRSAITDMLVTQMSYPNVRGARVHTGFYTSYLAVRSDYFSAVQKQLNSYPNYKVAVSGHSLGGAQAVLAAMDLYQRESRLGPNNLSIYTVGSPRIGNPEFAYYVDSTGIPNSRSVNERDIVPHVPSTTWGFLHSGTEAWKRSSNNVVICPSGIESDHCANSIAPFTSFTDHLNYYGVTTGACV